MELLATADSENTKIIEDNWGHIIDKLAKAYRDYKIKKAYSE
jgi:hypothetical protein